MILRYRYKHISRYFKVFIAPNTSDSNDPNPTSNRRLALFKLNLTSNSQNQNTYFRCVLHNSVNSIFRVITIGSIPNAYTIKFSVVYTRVKTRRYTPCHAFDPSVETIASHKLQLLHLDCVLQCAFQIAYYTNRSKKFRYPVFTNTGTFKYLEQKYAYKFSNFLLSFSVFYIKKLYIPHSFYPYNKKQTNYYSIHLLIWLRRSPCLLIANDARHLGHSKVSSSLPPTNGESTFPVVVSAAFDWPSGSSTPPSRSPSISTSLGSSVKSSL